MTPSLFQDSESHRTVTVGPCHFPKMARLLKSRDFKRNTDQGRKVHTPLFLVFVRKNGLETSRLGVTVSRKVGKAVLRNRVKRWLREFFRHWQARVADRWADRWDIVIIARFPAGQASHEAFDQTLEGALNLARTQFNKTSPTPRPRQDSP
ncbi:MAG: ribonuclease P protein component [Magnetococcales bacterium]|nr:ribonuclease P protein component [Magnetococcales bacterium]